MTPLRCPVPSHTAETSPPAEEIESLDATLSTSPLGWRSQSDIPYGPDPLQSFDALFPTSSPSPMPAVLLVHGGAWMGGDKAAPHYQLLQRQFANAGFAAFSTDYRLAPIHRFPAPAEDIASVAAHLTENAPHYQIDPDRIAVMGSSAGAHLASLIALAGDRFGAPERAGCSGPFAAAACIATPSDFRASDGEFSQSTDDPAAIALFGRNPSEIPEVAAEASPVAHAGPSAPPFLLFHNRADPRVDSRFSARLRDSLLAAGARCELQLFEGDSHGLRQIHGPVFRRVVEFFGEILRP